MRDDVIAKTKLMSDDEAHAYHIGIERGRAEGRARWEALQTALIELLHACERYDDDPDGTISQAGYLNAKAKAGALLGEGWRATAATDQA